MKLAIIIPAYNEELCIPYTVSKLTELLEQYKSEEIVNKESFLLIVDDGSKDNTWNEIIKAKESYPSIKAIKFSKNFGNQNAIMAGYKAAKNLNCDIALTIDADLQQDETKIKDFIESYKNGYEIVCGIRNSYQNKFSIKSISSNLFYKFVNSMGIYLKPNHSEYRLIGKKALDIIDEYKEANIFVRGMIYDLGLKTKYINYDIRKRMFGKSKFNYITLFKMALEAIVSYSIKPLRFVFFIGITVSLLSLLFALLMFIQLTFQIKIINLSTDIFAVWLTIIAGLQIFCIGIISEYVGQILIETKKRPRYIIEEEHL